MSAEQPALALRTPEGVIFRIPLAGPAARASALVIDQLAIFAALMVAGRILSLAPWLGGIGAAALVLPQAALSVLYGAAMEYFWRGQTLGKRALGLRVVDAGGLRLSGASVLVRNLLRAVDALPAFYMVGGIACLASRRGQRLGDLAAGTAVVRSEAARVPDLEAWRSGKFNSFAAAPALCLRLRERTSPAEAQLVLDALLQRERLLPEPRARLYRALVESLQAQVEFPAAIVATLSDEQYLRNAIAVLHPPARRTVG